MIKYRNTYRIIDDICYIDCYKKDGSLKGSILIDSEDLNKVCMYQWHIEKSRENIYYGAASFKGRTIRIHRVLLETPLQVDHINHNGLDNRKSNLRACTNAENNRNKKHINAISGYTGIRYNEKTGSYYVRIMVDKKEISLGSYKFLHDALEARKEGEIKYFKDFRYDDKIC